MRKHHKEDSSGWGRNFKKSLFTGSIPKENSVRGPTPRTIRLGGPTPHMNLPLPMMSNGGEIYQMQDRELYAWREIIKAWFKGERWS
jgi:hypothetical protein